MPTAACRFHLVLEFSNLKTFGYFHYSIKDAQREGKGEKRESFEHFVSKIRKRGPPFEVNPKYPLKRICQKPQGRSLDFQLL